MADPRALRRGEGASGCGGWEPGGILESLKSGLISLATIYISNSPGSATITGKSQRIVLSGGGGMQSDEEAQIDKAVRTVLDTSMPLADELTALADRLAVLRAIRHVAIVGLLIFTVLAIAGHNFWLIPIGLGSAWIMATVMSFLSAQKVKRATGLSHEYQEQLWDHYKRSPEFASQVNRILGLDSHNQDAK